MIGDDRNAGGGKHPIVPSEAVTQEPAQRLSERTSKDPDGIAIKSSVRRQNWIEVATLLVLTFSLFAAGSAAYEGSLLSRATDNLVKTQARTADRELRAYVGVLPGGVENFGDSQIQRFTIIRKNYGLTPAYNVFVKPTFAGVVRAGDKMPADEVAPPNLSGLPTLFPGLSLPFYVSGAEGVAKDQLDLVREG
jgi:hypothetical protein